MPQLDPQLWSAMMSTSWITVFLILFMKHYLENSNKSLVQMQKMHNMIINFKKTLLLTKWTWQ